MDTCPFFTYIFLVSYFGFGFTMLISFGFIFGYGITLLITCWSGPFFIKKPVVRKK